MQMLPLYQTKLGCQDDDAVFAYFTKTLKDKLLTWSYFVNWEKVFDHVKDLEIDLNQLNYLIGKPNFDDAFLHLLRRNPEVARSLPALVVRDGGNTKRFQILVDFANKKLVYEDFDFAKTNITEDDIHRYLEFVKETGLQRLIESKTLKNLVDYMIGVEAGLDSNARKNRSGTMMEEVVEGFVSDLCKRNNCQYLAQASAEKIKERFGIHVPVDKSSRRYDFAILSGRQLYLMETNFYGGGGSKLKATAGEYRKLHEILDRKFPFIWVTDGAGWRSTLRPLREAFNNMDYVFNLGMLENQLLEAVVTPG